MDSPRPSASRLLTFLTNLDPEGITPLALGAPFFGE